MTEEYVFKRRNRLKKHFVNTSNVLLYGYRNLSDGAKITYQVIDSFDWEDKETKTSKGYVFPAVSTIARIRGLKKRAVQYHLRALIKAGLLTRVRQKNAPSILVIEDISEAEKRGYLAEFVDRGGISEKRKILRSQDFAPKTEEEKKKENENNVNENKIVDKVEVTEPLRAILRRLPKPEVMNEGRSLDLAKKDYLAQKMAKELDDMESLGCYRSIAEKCPPELIFQVLSIVKDTANQGKVRHSRAALFVDLVKRFCQRRGVDLHFKGGERAKERSSFTKETIKASGQEEVLVMGVEGSAGVLYEAG